MPPSSTAVSVISLPDWVQWIQALGPTSASVVTAIIAGAVAMVAYRQWVTAREKLVLDLFQRRYSVFERVQDGLVMAIRDGDIRQNDSLRTIAATRSEAQFLFGPEVSAYLQELQATLAELGLARTQYDANNTEDDWPQRSLDASLKLLSAYEGHLARHFSPYLSMHQRVK